MVISCADGTIPSAAWMKSNDALRSEFEKPGRDKHTGHCYARETDESLALYRRNAENRGRSGWRPLTDPARRASLQPLVLRFGRHG